MARYVDILFRHWTRFAVILFLLPTPISIATLVYFRTYQAATDIWVENPTYFGSSTNLVGSSGISGWNQYLTPAQNEADELNQYLQTTSFLYAVGDRMAADGMSDMKEGLEWTRHESLAAFFNHSRPTQEIDGLLAVVDENVLKDVSFLRRDPSALH